jgi:DNA-binding NtrC family response regulator
LIQGESGTGKELVARALHLTSLRPGAFVAFNVCAIPEALFESALFGHVRGAFTGATCDSAGYLAEADGGTVFLDEIGSLSPILQAKLLRAIETRSFRAVGARHDRSSRFRVIAATNVSISVLLNGGGFRNDLAYRLYGDLIVTPALRDHADDIPELVQYFVRQCAADRQGIAIREDAMELLCAHPWSGNVRQLKHAVHRLVAYADRGTVDAPLVRRVLQGAPDQAEKADERGDVARQRLIQVLQEHGWRDQPAAAALGVHPTTVFRWRKALGIQRPATNAPRALRHQSHFDRAPDADSSAHCSNSAMHCSNAGELDRASTSPTAS